MRVRVGSAVLGVVRPRPAAGVPFRALVAVGGDSSGPFEQDRQVHPVQVMTLVLRLVKSFSGPPAEPRSRYDGPGPAGSDPASVGLRQDGVAEVLEA